MLLCAPCDRSGRSAWPEVAPGLTPDSIQQKYIQMVVSTWIDPGCVQFLGEEKCFHTAWVICVDIAMSALSSAILSIGHYHLPSPSEQYLR